MRDRAPTPSATLIGFRHQDAAVQSVERSLRTTVAPLYGLRSGLLGAVLAIRSTHDRAFATVGIDLETWRPSSVFTPDEGFLQVLIVEVFHELNAHRMILDRPVATGDPRSSATTSGVTERICPVSSEVCPGNTGSC